MTQAPAMHQHQPLHTSAALTDTTPEERTYAMFIHLGGLLSLLDLIFLGAIASGVMWWLRKDESTFIDDHGRETLNFHLSILLYVVAGGLAVAMTFGLGVVLFLPMLIGLWVVRLVAGIRGAMAANRGQHYRYPICIRFLAEPF